MVRGGTIRADGRRSGRTSKSSSAPPGAQGKKVGGSKPIKNVKATSASDSKSPTKVIKVTKTSGAKPVSGVKVVDDDQDSASSIGDSSMDEVADAISIKASRVPSGDAQLYFASSLLV
jgi:hypothetical protein